MCSLLLLGILITSKLYPGELLQKRNSGQPNLYLKIPHRPTEQDSDEFHRQLRATQGKCFQIVLNYWMQNACLSAFPTPVLCPPFLPMSLHPHTCICNPHASHWLTKRLNVGAPKSKRNNDRSSYLLTIYYPKSDASTFLRTIQKVSATLIPIL